MFHSRGLFLLVPCEKEMKLSANSHSYSAALMRLSDEDLKLKQMSLRLKRAETELQAHLASCQHEERLITKHEFWP